MYKEYETVLLKDGRVAAIVELLGEGVYIADVGHSPKDWDDIIVKDEDIERLASKEEIEKEAEGQITQMNVVDTRPVIAYDGDVNGTTLTDVNDAQFVYGIYNKNFEMDITKQDDMQKLLRADMNGDGVIDIKDAAAVIDKVMHPETADKK